MKRDTRPIWKRVCDSWSEPYAPIWGRKVGSKPTMTVIRATEILNLASANGLTGQSKINPGLTRAEMHGVLILSVNGKPGDAKLQSLIAKNIAREFGREFWKTIKPTA